MSERLKAHQALGESSADRPTQTTRLPDRAAVRGGPGGPRPGGVALDSVLARIHALPAVSPIVVRALQLTYSEQSAPREIANVVASDYRFAGRLVAAANLPCYHLPRRIKTVGEAVLLLGTDAFREVVLIASMGDVLYRDLSGYGVSAREFWAHSLACGIAAEIVAEITNYTNRTEAFIAGLLHDVGKIVLNEDMKSAAPFVRDQMARDQCSFAEAERTVLGYDHCDIGARLLRAWGIPQHIVQAVALHRKPVVDLQTVPLAGYVHLGEILCSVTGVGIGFEGLDILLETRVLGDFKLTAAMADTAVSRLVDRLNASQTLLALGDAAAA